MTMEEIDNQIDTLHSEIADCNLIYINKRKELVELYKMKDDLSNKQPFLEQEKLMGVIPTMELPILLREI